MHAYIYGKFLLFQIKLTQKETLINTWSNFDKSKYVKVTGHQRNKPGIYHTKRMPYLMKKYVLIFF